jgi:uncharacterized glyoxalase superfamily protein PhnB
MGMRGGGESMKHMGASILGFTIVAALLAVLSLNSGIRNAVAEQSQKPILVNTCLITGRFSQVVDFYRNVLRIAPQVTNGDYAEFRTGAGVLAVFSASAEEKYIPGSAEPARNRSVILEFRVSNVDAEYTRLQKIVQTWVKPPTNQPWGTRSFYFRDPDGNLVDFYAPVKTEAGSRSGEEREGSE